jgi:hypothetical protein
MAACTPLPLPWCSKAAAILVVLATLQGTHTRLSVPHPGTVAHSLYRTSVSELLLFLSAAPSMGCVDACPSPLPPHEQHGAIGARRSFITAFPALLWCEAGLCCAHAPWPDATWPPAAHTQRHGAGNPQTCAMCPHGSQPTARSHMRHGSTSALPWRCPS